MGEIIQRTSQIHLQPKLNSRQIINHLFRYVFITKPLNAFNTEKLQKYLNFVFRLSALDVTDGEVVGYVESSL